MKVLEVVASLAVGGAERVAVEVAAGLNAKPASPWQAELGVIGAHEGGTTYVRSIQDEAVKRGVSVHNIAFSSPFDRASRKRFRGLLEARGIDLVHIHNRPRDWQLALLCRLVGVPVLYTVHKPYTHGSGRTRTLYAALARTVLPVICVSRAVSGHIQACEHVPPKNIRVIYNGVRMEVYAPLTPAQRAAKRAELGWSDEAFIWFCAARFHPQKAHEFLLEAMAHLPAGGRARLMLAGEGPLEATLRQQAERLQLGDRVTFLGPRYDVPELLGAADAYVSCSREEGHPLALLEAMACELPILAPRLPSIEEIAMQGVPAFFGPRVQGIASLHDARLIAEGMESLQRGVEVARRAASAARGHVATKFSLDAMVDQHAALYTQVIGQRASLGARVFRRIGAMMRPVGL